MGAGTATGDLKVLPTPTCLIWHDPKGLCPLLALNRDLCPNGSPMTAETANWAQTDIRDHFHAGYRSFSLLRSGRQHRKQSMRKPLLNVEKDMKCHSYSDDTQNNSRVPIYWNLLLFESCLFLWDSLNFPGAGNKIPRGYSELHSEHFQSLNAVGIKTFPLMHLNKPC